MDRTRMWRRLGGLVVALVLAGAATAAQGSGDALLEDVQAPRAPASGIITTESAGVWNGHGCFAEISVDIGGLGAELGGYATRVTWPAGRFSSNPSDVVVELTDYLRNGGARSQTGDSGTPPLQLEGIDSVMFGAYSWGPGNPPGNLADGQLAWLLLRPAATCGPAPLTLSETILVDIEGALIPDTSESGSTVQVYSRFDTNAAGATIDAADVEALLPRLGQATGGPCGPNYRYDTSLSGPLINSGDVNAVLARLGQSTSAACTD